MTEMYEFGFRREGSAFVYEVPDLRTRFEFRAPHGTAMEVKSEVVAYSTHPDMKTYENGLVLAPATINLLALATRKQYATAIQSRFSGPIADERGKPDAKQPGIDWLGTFEHAAALALEAHRRGDPFVWLEPMPKTSAPRFAVPPFLPTAMPSMLFGLGETMKSLLAMAFAVTVSSGQPVINGLPPALHGPVLYLDWETTEQEASERVELLCRGAGIPFLPGMVRYRACRGPLWRQIEAISREVDREGIVLIIIDAMLAASGSSRDGQPMEEGSTRLFESLKECRATALLIHHENKAGEQYGSVYNRNFSRASWQVRRLSEDDESIHLGLFHDKASTAKKEVGGRGFAIDWAKGADRIVVRQEAINPVTQAVAAGGSMSNSERMMEALIRSEHPMSYKELHLATGLDENMVRQYVSRDKSRKAGPLFKFFGSNVGLTVWEDE